MDSIDKNILIQLQQNAKQNTKEIASKVGLSVTPTYERIKKLEQNGVIKSYVAILDRKKIGKEVVVYCQVSILKHQKSLIDDFGKTIQDFPEITECHYVSGNYDFLVKIVVNTIAEFHQFLNEKLSSISGVSTVHSSFLYYSVKDTPAIPI